MTTTSEPVPAWLVAWRERRGEPQQAAQPVTHTEQPAAPAPAPTTPTPPAQPALARAVPAPVAPKVHRMSKGFYEPAPWEFDDCTRREAVLDQDHHPPRVVRKVGWQRCMRCRQPFFSEDVTRLRMCGGPGGCRENEDRFAQGETGGSYRLHQG